MTRLSFLLPRSIALAAILTAVSAAEAIEPVDSNQVISQKTSAQSGLVTKLLELCDSQDNVIYWQTERAFHRKELADYAGSSKDVVAHSLREIIHDAEAQVKGHSQKLGLQKKSLASSLSRATSEERRSPVLTILLDIAKTQDVIIALENKINNQEDSLIKPKQIGRQAQSFIRATILSNRKNSENQRDHLTGEKTILRDLLPDPVFTQQNVNIFADTKTASSAIKNNFAGMPALK